MKIIIFTWAIGLQRFLLLIRKYYIGYEGCRSSKLQIEECHDVCLPNIVDDHKKFSFRTETLD